MARIFLLYLTGLLQGIAIVLYPAAGNLLTSPRYHDLSSSDYGAIFLPQIIGAILASLIGGRLGGVWGLKPVYLAGMFFNACALFIFAGTSLILNNLIADLAILFISTFLLGIGFGCTLTMINTYVVELFPKRSSTAVTALHSLLGLGTALAPILFTLFMELSLWWVCPFIIAIGFILLICAAWIIFEHQEPSLSGEEERNGQRLTGIFYLYASIVFIYGICETVFGNWSTIYLKQEKMISSVEAGMALSLFWGMVTIGRILVACLSFWILPIRIFSFLPMIIILSFVLIPFMQSPLWNILVFGLAGLGCSACFPLSISFSTRHFFSIASKVGGIMMALYMSGYGVAAYGVGLLHEDAGVSLGRVYAISSLLAVALAILVLILAKAQKNQ